MPGYDETQPDVSAEMIGEASEAFLAYIYLENADQAKYGTVIRDLRMRKSLGEDNSVEVIFSTTHLRSLFNLGRLLFNFRRLLFNLLKDTPEPRSACAASRTRTPS